MKMRVMFNLLAVVFILGGLLFSCSKPEKTTPASETTTYGQPSGSASTIGNAQSSLSAESRNKYISTIIKIDVSGKVIKAEQLKELLPQSIAGTEKSQPSIGTIFGENNDVTTASYSYSFKNGGLVIQISDFGEINNIPEYDKKYFFEAPELEGKEIETVIDEIGKGYVIWDNEQNSGSMYYLLANRFVLKLEAYTLPPGSGGLTAYFNMINRNKIIAKAKN
jgi:hypothetical protein